MVNFPGPYDYARYGLDPHLQRSESTENEIARRQLPANPPVTVLSDLIGQYSPAVGQQNALIDAIRARILQKMMETGAPATNNYNPDQNYGR